MNPIDLPAITHVWSTFGHRFIDDGSCAGHDDGSSCERCITCGAIYELCRRTDDLTGGDYCAANGDDPAHCSQDTAMCHGEEPCHADGGRPCDGRGEPCPHTSHSCNCLLCTG
ncbi:hypothetical protein ACIBKX_07870 [Streptomyces sp. NPDC050658]|uniref:hypothetical protein n=1 Tax=unclassified Streptomyces TaxID=2593676 RepID=UPI003431C485